MQPASSQRPTVSSLLVHLDNRGAKGDTELRASSSRSTRLYGKTRPSFFTHLESRARRQNNARVLISQALDNQFGSMKGGPELANRIRQQMPEIFQGNKVLTRSDLAKVADKASSEKQAYTAGFHAKVLLHSSSMDQTKYDEGVKNFRAVLREIPGAKKPETMDHQDVIKLYAQLSTESPDAKKLGALDALLREKSVARKDRDLLENAKPAIENARNHGAVSLKVLPRLIPLRDCGKNMKVRQSHSACLVALAALSESKQANGMDRLLTRLEHEAHKGVHEPNKDYGKQLDALDFLVATSRPDVRTQPVGHHRVLELLVDEFEEKGFKPVMYIAENGSNNVLIGMTKQEGGTPLFSFYDPDFGAARFTSKEQLSGFLDSYYDTAGKGQGYKFDALQRLDLDGLAQIKDIDLLLEPEADHGFESHLPARPDAVGRPTNAGTQ